MRRRSSIRASVLAAAAVLIFLPGTALPSDETIPPRSWVYPALRSFELLGLVDLAPASPYTRSEIESYVDRILQSAGDSRARLTPRQKFLLGRLRAEFQGMSGTPAGREDRPLWMMREGRRFFTLDVEAGGGFVKREIYDDGEINGILIPEVLLDMGGPVTLEAAYLLRMGPERDGGCTGRGCSRVRSWRGLTSEYERGYIAFSGTRWRLQLGRDYLQWGPNGPAGLILSTAARSIDHLAFDISMGRFTLRMFQAALDPYLPRKLAGHRLEIRLPAGMTAGVSETVLYTGRDLDWSYLMPFGAYYANQWNEKDDDNILWSVDLKVQVARGLLISGELLIDDLQYEDDPPAPDKLGWTVRADALVMPLGHDIEISASYTRVDLYTYSHKDSLVTSYLAGGGDKDADTFIGDPLGPDADRWNVRLASPLHPRALLSLEGSFIRRGEGNDLRQWEWGGDPDPPFPSGGVTDERIYTAGVDVDLGRGSYIETNAGLVIRDGPEGKIEEGFGRLIFVWDF